MLATPDEETATASEEDKDEVTAMQVKEYARMALSPNDYKLFFLRFIKEFTLQQTGEYIGCSISCVQRRSDKIKTRISNHFQNQLAI